MSKINIKIFIKCIQECEECVRSCSKLDGMESCINTCNDCIRSCRLCLEEYNKFTNNELYNKLLYMCILACNLCISVCGVHVHHQACINCVIASKNCIEMCNNYLNSFKSKYLKYKQKYLELKNNN